jgi:hypothetical protein
MLIYTEFPPRPTFVLAGYIAYHHISVSHLDVSFPSSFYQPEIELYDRNRRYTATDPHHWWHRLHHHHHHHHKNHDRKLAQGPHVALASTGEYRDELLDALFDFESTWPEHLLHTLPLRELEHTYGYKLYRVKATTSGMVMPGSELIIEVGRFFCDLASAMKVAGDDDERNSLVRREYTLGALYRRCLDREVLGVPPVVNGSGSGSSSGSTEKRTKQSLDKIYHVLRALNHVANLPEELPNPLSTDLMGSFILDTLDGMYIRDAAPRSAKPAPHVEDHMHFAPKELCFKTLTELGGLKIAWTNLYTQHLRLIRSSKTLLLFWDVSILGQSPLFSHWPQWMPKSKFGAAPEQQGPTNLESYNTGSAGLLEELQRSYRIIFGNPDGRFLERFFRKHFRRAGDDVGIVLHDLESIMMGSQRTRVNISRSSARQALKYYLRAAIPSSILALRPELDRRKHKGPRQRYNWHISNILHRKTSGKLVDLLNAGPPYPLDFWMHISYLLELSQSSSLSELETYSAYPIFGDRLRELKTHMDKQRPKNLRQLFKDRRDTVGYWAFWAVVFVGGSSILLALISIAVSSAQVVAGFRALRPLGQAAGQGDSVNVSSSSAA